MTRFACFSICVALCLGQVCGSPDVVPLPDDGPQSDQTPPAEPPGSVDGNDQDGDSSPPDTPPSVEPESCIPTVSEATWQVFIGIDNEPVGWATAFAIAPYLLGTNAHVVEPIADTLREPGGWATLVQNETGVMVDVVNVWAHPDYNGNGAVTPDVGIIEVDTKLDSILPIASYDDLYGLAVLDDLILCGFPGDVFKVIDFANRDPDDVFRPRVTCMEGKITALRPFDASLALTPENAQLIQSDLPTTQGTSGSAIVDISGQVLAVNSSSTTDEAGLNRFAPRADTLLDLLSQVEDGSLAPLSLEPVADDSPFPDDGPACAHLWYYNLLFGFGFDPPLDYLGPFIDEPLPGGLLELFFDPILGPRIRIAISVWVYKDLDTWLVDWAVAQASNGWLLVNDNRYLMLSGEQLAVIEWYEPILEVGLIEAWVITDGLAYRFHSLLLISSDFLYETAILESFRTICVE